MSMDHLTCPKSNLLSKEGLLTGNHLLLMVKIKNRQKHILPGCKKKKKNQWNASLIEKKMESTYSFRRKMLNEGKHSLKRVKQCTMYSDSRRLKWIFGVFNCKKDMGHIEDAEDSDDSSGHRGQQNVPGLVNLEFPLYQQVIRRLRKRISLKVSSNLREQERYRCLLVLLQNMLQN